MNKKMLALSMTAALAAVPAISMAATPGNWFISGQVGESNLQGMSATNDTATGSAFMAGYRWDLNPMFQLGAEIGYANTGTYKDTYYGTTADAKLEGFLAGVTGKVNFTPNWYMNFEGGYFNAKQTTSGSTVVGNTFYSYGANHTKGSFYSGIGFGYDFDNNIGLGLNYNYFEDKDGPIDLSSGMTTLRLEVRF